MYLLSIYTSRHDSLENTNYPKWKFRVVQLCTKKKQVKTTKINLNEVINKTKKFVSLKTIVLATI